MLITTKFTSSTSLLIGEIKKIRRAVTEYIATILCYGTFGSGTMEFYLSPDGGTTKIPLTPNMGGTPLTCTANAMAVITSGHPSNNFDTLQIWATLSGATSPSVTVNLYDNNN